MTLRDAKRKTQLTEWQLRGLIRRNEIRWRKVGKLIHIHPEDIEALERRMWKGAPLLI